MSSRYTIDRAFTFARFVFTFVVNHEKNDEETNPAHDSSRIYRPRIDLISRLQFHDKIRYKEAGQNHCESNNFLSLRSILGIQNEIHRLLGSYSRRCHVIDWSWTHSKSSCRPIETTRVSSNHTSSLKSLCSIRICSLNFSNSMKYP